MKHIKTYEKRLGKAPFKVGDLVYCIESSYGHDLEITEGEIYKINNIFSGEYKYLCSIENDTFGFFCRKFRKPTKEELSDHIIRTSANKYNL